MKRVIGLCLVTAFLTGCTSSLPHHYDCQDGIGFNAMVTSESALIRFKGKERDIPRIRSASGAQYESEDKKTGLYTKGEEAMLVWDEQTLRYCVMQ
ncbi:hypothetical protein BCT30_10880 [Enterovibrio norvegicus]|uniref:C-type lysozyme inhibitor domain-containing protein n=1 Tax=Enterovibrio norvegicus TaxID=188144 RepID=A0A2N7L6J4_9GAMM|nr:MliC family protein [Enterovibrio norvegicus]MCC4799773.1 MliC family protein [Enterovibrio norvegicus]PMH71167.1 hypothetical protein BCU62_05930 [Enterovibrio norvegicus]PMI34089.1 hypothetical protein BCU47_01585 [Enterovibrio norvegicus]PMI38730.1 hypothetical protein BCU46_07695 [Enterovibrio norvegicus]PMN53562.1 hypothetical protein BCT30_10880 [Enterovibrio norvegicus]